MRRLRRRGGQVAILLTTTLGGRPSRGLPGITSRVAMGTALPARVWFLISWCRLADSFALRLASGVKASGEPASPRKGHSWKPAEPAAAGKPVARRRLLAVVSIMVASGVKPVPAVHSYIAVARLTITGSSARVLLLRITVSLPFLKYPDRFDQRHVGGNERAHTRFAPFRFRNLEWRQVDVQVGDPDFNLSQLISKRLQIGFGARPDRRPQAKKDEGSPGCRAPVHPVLLRGWTDLPLRR